MKTNWILILSLAVLSANQAIAEDCILTYEETSIGYVISGASNKSTCTSAVIPSTYNDKPVISIGAGSFYQATNLESIHIPNTVTSIGAGAFDTATKLTGLVIPDSVTTIGDWAFDRTYALKTLVIPDSVTKLGYAAFYSAGIQNLTIPDTLALDDIRPSNVQDARPWTYTTFGNVQNVTCAGAGDTSKCDALLSSVGKNIHSVSKPNYQLDENGKIVGRYEYDENGNLKKLTQQKNDGSLYSYDANGKLIGIQGKKIFSVDEAAALVKNNKNTFSIKYR